SGRQLRPGRPAQVTVFPASGQPQPDGESSREPSKADYDLSKLNWIRQIDNSDPQRPADTSTAVVGGDVAAGRVDFFSKWEPNSYCPLHRHLGDTISVVLQGEHFIEELDGSRRMRPPGHY